ncbi:nucleotide-binding oligomerization domain-containing protein 2 isoform X2 [Ambystoma mexicanum]|uniref:nucleotide-binding oligomerization domain-containing protein 2 isoform X2 n=1 Tax=Ambystoma mexicanum TaxID=8296 RepID=UPI0037E936FF
MCAQELHKAHRSRLVAALAGGSVENFESVLDYLLSWDVLSWEDYESVNVRGRSLPSLARGLLDILWCKGDQVYGLLVAALGEEGAGRQPVQARLPELEELSEAPIYLKKHRPAIVGRVHGHVEHTLKYLLNANFVSKYECDEIQLPIYTPSQQVRRLLDVVKAKGNEAALRLLQYIQALQERSTILHNDDRWTKYQKKLKSTVLAQSCFLNTYDGAENVRLEDVYTESVLELAKKISGFGTAQPYSNLVGLKDIFNAGESMNEDADTVLVSGEAGSGKSTLLQQIHFMWATGKAFLNFSFIFPFNCRQLCCIEKPVSLKSLLFDHCCWPDIDQEDLLQSILDHPQQVLLTFDGFDEFKFKFTDEERHCSPTEPTSVPSILFNLVQGNLMKGARKVVSSRPGAISACFRKYIQKEVCVKGFSQRSIELFMRKTQNDLRISETIIDLLNTNASLHSLCRVPVFCWIVSKCHKELILGGCYLPQTMTDIYLLSLRHFLLHTLPAKERTENILFMKMNTIHHLGKLALSGLGNCSYVFSARQLKEAEVSEEDLSSGFLILSRNFSHDSLTRHYEFIHITFQCFFMALHVAANDQLSSTVIRYLLTHTRKNVECSLFRMYSKMCLRSVHGEERKALAMLHHAETCNLQMATSFLAGLLSKRHYDLLVESWKPEKLPQKQTFFKQCLAKGIQKHFKSIPPAVHGEKKSMHAMPEFVWLIKCIHEMQDSHLAMEAVSDFEAEHLKLTYCGIGPSECTALAFVLKYLKNPIGLQLDHNTIGDLGIEQLEPCLNLCQALYLRDNNISDKGIGRLLDQALHWQNFQKIALFNNKLTDECMHCFANLLRQKKNFIALRLGNNYITSEGAEVLAGGLKESKSLQYLGLWGNSVGSSGAGALAEALHNNQSLIWLSLVGNSIGSTGAQALATMIGTNPALQELCLEENRVEDEDVLAFAEALKKNSKLKILKLSNNAITKAGVTALLEALAHNDSITSIWLRGNALTSEETEVFASLDARLLF